MPNDWTTNKGKKAAAKLYLTRLATDKTMRERVVKSGKDDRKYSHDQFKTIGDCPNIPDDIEVICLEPDRDHLNKLVVFKLPPKVNKLLKEINPLAHWIAAWVPYGPGKARRTPGE